ncbi:MAG: agmatinase [Candidatus Aminicenantes bacterium]|nr:agmatinase [Candidatus Aminicenantes bacterium]
MTDFGGAIRKGPDCDVAIIGIPYDDKSSYLKGPAKGPQAIREASTSKMINAWTELGIDLETEIKMMDLGDLDVSGQFLEVFSRIEEKIGTVLSDKIVPIILGGDHSISYPIVKAFWKKYGCLDILDFDAHADLYDELYGDRFSHACPFARIMEDRLAQNLVQVGIRTANSEHRKQADKYNVRMIEMKDFDDSLWLEFQNPLYISFDLDALDPAYAPGVSHHEAGGLTTRQVVNIIHRLKANIVGLDVVEVNPDREKNGITAAAAVKVIKEVIGKIVFDRKKQ